MAMPAATVATAAATTAAAAIRSLFLHSSSLGHAPTDHVKHSYHEMLGVDIPTYALILAFVSGLSLPLGAMLGVQLSPVDDRVCAAMMAFGAGALLFAVTIELYGHALGELQRGGMGMLQLVATISFALVGALFYLFMNRALEHWLDYRVEGSESSPKSSPTGSACRTPSDMSLQRQKQANSDDEESLGTHYNADDRGPSRQSSLPANYGSTFSAAGFRSTGSKKMSALMLQLPEVPPEQLQRHRRGRAMSLLKLLPTDGLNRQLSDRSHASRMASPGAQTTGGRLSIMDKARLSDASSTFSMPDERKASGQLSAKSGEEVDEEATIHQARSTASALFLGLLLDGIPEGILMGFLAAEGNLSPVLIISLFVANFPEAFSSASLLIIGRMPVYAIVGMWTILCVGVACITGVSCKLLLIAYPTYSSDYELPLMMQLFVAMVEGITGGAMMACISSVMLPEAFERAGEDGALMMSSGFLCTCGFLLAVFLKASLG